MLMLELQSCASARLITYLTFITPELLTFMADFSFWKEKSQNGPGHFLRSFKISNPKKVTRSIGPEWNVKLSYFSSFYRWLCSEILNRLESTSKAQFQPGLKASSRTAKADTQWNPVPKNQNKQTDKTIMYKRNWLVPTKPLIRAIIFSCFSTRKKSAELCVNRFIQATTRSITARNVSPMLQFSCPHSPQVSNHMRTEVTLRLWVHCEKIQCGQLTIAC